MISLPEEWLNSGMTVPPADRRWFGSDPGLGGIYHQAISTSLRTNLNPVATVKPHKAQHILKVQKSKRGRKEETRNTVLSVLGRLTCKVLTSVPKGPWIQLSTAA